jgi:hypothetical protein
MISPTHMLKTWPLLLSGALLSVLARPSAQEQLASGSCKEYRGTLGEKTQIGMSLYAKDQSLQGSYFYKSHLTDIPLTGRHTAARDISLSEMDSANHPKGTFLLHFAESDPDFQTSTPLQAEVLQGKWVSADGKSSYPVYLQLEHDCATPGQTRYGIAGATSDALVEKNAQAFYNAVVAGNRTAAAKYVSYPATFFQGGKRVSIARPAEFLKDYDQLFTTAFVEQIAKAIPHHMFVNAQGIMLADGAVWFDAEGKAKHFNNQPLPQ